MCHIKDNNSFKALPNQWATNFTGGTQQSAQNGNTTEFPRGGNYQFNNMSSTTNMLNMIVQILQQLFQNQNQNGNTQNAGGMGNGARPGNGIDGGNRNQGGNQNANNVNRNQGGNQNANNTNDYGRTGGNHGAGRGGNGWGAAGNLGMNGGQGTAGRVIKGTAGADDIKGTKGDDTIIRTSGKDAVDGGKGNDTFVIKGNPSDYTITVTGADGTTVLKNVENLKFTGGRGPVALPLSAEDQAMADKCKTNGWLFNHGDYTHQPDGSYTNGQGYKAVHRENGKYDVFNKDGRNLGQWENSTKTDKVASPIAFDLNNDGKIGTTGQTTAKDGQRTELGNTVRFDLDGDGTQESVEWMSGDGDGLLVDTSKIGPNNAIDGNALFGDMGGKFENGYNKLAQHDTNGDGKLTGNELADLGVWVDNGDGVLQDAEMRSLKDLDVTDISTQKQDVQNAKGETLMRSSAQTANGGTLMTEDVWFGKE